MNRKGKEEKKMEEEEQKSGRGGAKNGTCPMETLFPFPETMHRGRHGAEKETLGYEMFPGNI